jgi:lipoate---protein ligase
MVTKHVILPTACNIDEPHRSSKSMLYLEYTCSTAAEDLALDEALLDEAESGSEPREVLRVWELRRPTVVLGRSSQAAVEANVAECRRRGIDVLRRTSGGAAIIAGPGCLMYSVVLAYEHRPHLRALDEAHRFVLNTVLEAVRPYVPAARCRGTSDLAVEERKFSGNSLRCRREHLLYHGTLLYDFPLELIAACLGTPPRQPDYRQARPHGEFVCNLPVPRDALIVGLRDAFGARDVYENPPWDAAAKLVEQKYRRTSWNDDGVLGTQY